MKERLEKSPQDQQDNKFAVTARDFLAASSEPEDLSIYFKNKEFIFAFPRLAIYLIGSEGRAEFSEDQRADLFSLSLRTFLSNKDQRISGRYAFTQDGQVVIKDNKGITQIVFSDQPAEPPSKDARTDSLTSALTASILLIGMSIPDKERQMSLLIESYKNLSTSKKDTFIDTLGRLLAQDNAIRIWIKEKKLDTDNGFDWDLELSRLLFFGIYASGIEHLHIPQEMRQGTVEHFSVEARSVILNFALEHAENLNALKSSIILTEFIMQMEKMKMTEDMREKLNLFKQKVGFKMAIA